MKRLSLKAELHKLVEFNVSWILLFIFLILGFEFIDR